MAIHWDDLPDDKDNLVWLVQTTLSLVPRGVVTPEEVSEEALTICPTSTALVGKPVKCPDCGYTAINSRGFPWGEERYGRDAYCPRCADGPDE